MNKKLGPFIFLTVLVIVLVFIFGVRLGEKVEKDNKKVDFFLSLPPTSTPAPTTAPLEFKTLTHAGCGLSFLYPSFYTIEKESSFSATIKSGKKFLSFNCQKNVVSEPTVNPDYVSLVKTNLKNGKKIVFTVEKSLVPLLEKSLEFLSK